MIILRLFTALEMILFLLIFLWYNAPHPTPTFRCAMRRAFVEWLDCNLILACLGAWVLGASFILGYI